MPLYSTLAFMALGIAGFAAFYHFVMPKFGDKGVQEGKSATFRSSPILDTPYGIVNPISWKHIGKMRYECIVSTGNNEQTIIIDEANDVLEPKNSKVEMIFGAGAQQWEWKPYAKEHTQKTQEKASIVTINKLQEDKEQIESEKKLAETTSDLALDKKVEDAAALAKAGKQPAQRFGQR